MAKNPKVSIELREFNDSELVLLCSWVGIKASRAWSRELLIYALENFEPVDIEDAFYRERDLLSKFLTMHWGRFRMQASKKVCPHCFECREMQILECYMKNRRPLEG